MNKFEKTEFMKNALVILGMTVAFLVLVFGSFHYGSWFIYNNKLHEELGAKKPYTEEQVVAFLEAEKTVEFLESGKYSQERADELLATFGNLLPYETEIIDYSNKYVSGWQVIFIDYEEQLNATTSETYLVRKTKSYGYGGEAKSRTWDWR